MTINSEEIVQIALTAYSKVHPDKQVDLKFELELRRMLMQREWSQSKVTHTYSIAPGSLTGTWTGGTTSNPSPTSVGTLLHG